MKAYLVTTGTIFFLILIAHIMRLIQEGTHTASNPVFLLTTVITTAMFLWSVWLLRSPRA